MQTPQLPRPRQMWERASGTRRRRAEKQAGAVGLPVEADPTLDLRAVELVAGAPRWSGMT